MNSFSKDIKNKSALSTRWAQMSKQEQIIEKKKMEIQAKLEAQKQAAALAAHAKLAQCGETDDGSNNIFSNDGSFMNQFKTLLEKQKKEKEEKEKLERAKEDALNEEKRAKNETKKEPEPENFGYDYGNQEENDNMRNNHHRDGGRNHSGQHRDDRRRSDDNGHRDRHRSRWNERGRNRHHSPGMEDMRSTMENRHHENHIPSLMQLPMRPPENDSQATSEAPNQWNMPPAPPPFNMGDQGMGPNMGQRPNMGPMMGHNPNMPPMPPGPPGMPPNGPMPPFMGGPPNFPPMPPFMSPNGPGGPNMRGPNGPNGPMPPWACPPFPNGPMMRPNAPPPPPPSMMPPNSMNNGNMNMPFMGQPPFGPNGPNFGSGNGPPNMPFMPPGSMPPMPPNLMNRDSKPMENTPQDHMKLPNIPSPMSMNNMPGSKDMDRGSVPPPPPPPSQVSSTDLFGPGVLRAANDVARNGDHWESVLKATQDQTMWFLHNPNSNEYKAFRELVNRFKDDKKVEIKPEDKYEPEFSLEDDESNDGPKYNVKEDNSRDSNSNSYSNPSWGNQQQQQQYPWSGMKREQASSQSDEEQESKKERRKRKKKSRWGDDPPLEIPPPVMMAAMPPLPPGPMPPAMPHGPMPPAMPPVPMPPGGMPLPGAALGKIEGDGLKLVNVNRNNQALMQYAMTNYGTTNLSAEDWKKCEDNFKLNLLYQDMLKKRQEVERLAAAGKHKYDYDSDEDTAEGTWEHKLRAREMNATEKWATELTKQATGKHHIGDFLPPEELKKFMEKYTAAKGGKEPDLSDYKEFKLKEDNVGFKMLQKLGWSEGQGLGTEGTGIIDPINKANQPVANLGLGAASGDNVCPDDDEFDAYRKRMMLAYRFRPNPLNNPRRPYY